MNEPSEYSETPNALLSFTAENVRSFRQEVNLSMLATRLAEADAVRSVSVSGSSKLIRTVPSAGVFGANASGKSMLLRAMHDMRQIVVNSYVGGDTLAPIRRQAFLLDPACADLPSRFGTELVIDGVRWEYEFEVDDRHVRSERASFYPRGRPVMLYQRQEGDVVYGRAFRAADRSWDWLLRDNALLLSVAGFAGDKQLLPLYNWFDKNLWLVGPWNRRRRIVLAARGLRSPTRKQRILDLVRYADLGVVDARAVVETTDAASSSDADAAGLDFREEGGGLGEPGRVLGLRLTHEAHIEETGDGIAVEETDAPGETKHRFHREHRVEFDFDEESLGTQTWVGLIPAVMDALDSGRVLLIDELDSSLHPHLVERLVEVFQRRRTNPFGAQLIFNTHDASVLGNTGQPALGRDQMWFTEKGLDGATTLYSLADFSPAPRRDDAIERRYLRGRYGAIPSTNPADLARALPASADDDSKDVVRA